MSAQPRVNGTRLWDSLMEMAQIGAIPKGGVCRLALSEEDRLGRDLFVRWAKEAGCSVRVDAMGNIFARRAGRNDALAPILTGDPGVDDGVIAMRCELRLMLCAFRSNDAP